MRHSFTHALTLWLALHLAAASVSAQTPAQLWQTLGANNQTGYALGVMDGVTLASLESTRLFADTLARGMWLKEQTNARVPIDSGFALLLKPYRVGNVEAVVNGMTKLYDEPANVCLPFFLVARAAMRLLSGTSVDAVESDLRRFRGVSATRCAAR